MVISIAFTFFSSRNGMENTSSIVVKFVDIVLSKHLLTVLGVKRRDRCVDQVPKLRLVGVDKTEDRCSALLVTQFRVTSSLQKALIQPGSQAEVVLSIILCYLLLSIFVARIHEWHSYAVKCSPTI